MNPDLYTAYPSLHDRLWRRLRDVPGHIVRLRDSLVASDFSRVYQTVSSYTMSSYPRLRALYAAVCTAVRNRVPGDVVECGTARGGSFALMALALEEFDVSEPPRQAWAFDTFEGLPPPSTEDPDYDIAKDFVGACRGELRDLEELLERLSIRDRCVLVKGLFQQTLPVSGPDRISVLHLDGDWYESVKVCLDHLYDRVSPGGIIQFDDYGHWAGARKAINEFLQQRGLSDVPLRYLDYTGRQLIKPSGAESNR